MVHTFPKYISLKVNAPARMGFELAYYVVSVEHVSKYTTRNQNNIDFKISQWIYSIPKKKYIPWVQSNFSFGFNICIVETW